MTQRPFLFQVNWTGPMLHQQRILQLEQGGAMRWPQRLFVLQAISFDRTAPALLVQGGRPLRVSRIGFDILINE
jgi:hypothetical protein